MENILFTISLLLIAITLHEIGHFLSFLLLTNKIPTIRIKWFWLGIEMGNNLIYSLKPYELFIISWGGIIGGIVPLLFIKDLNFSIFLLYLLMCCVDIVNILSLSDIKKEHLKLNILEISKIKISELEKEYGKKIRKI